MILNLSDPVKLTIAVCAAALLVAFALYKRHKISRAPFPRSSHLQKKKRQRLSCLFLFT